MSISLEVLLEQGNLLAILDNMELMVEDNSSLLYTDQLTRDKVMMM